VTFDGTGTSVLSLGAAQSVASLTSAGAATVTLGANTLTVGTSTGSTTLAGIIGGTGGLIKDGASTQVLTGANTYTGATTVSAGALAVNGSLASAVTVASGGTLKGSGTITGSTSVSSGGTLAPGNSINTLSIDGNLSFTTGSIFEWELDTTQSNPTTNRGTAYDAVNVTGSVTGEAIFKIVLMGTTGFAGSFWNTSRTWANIFAKEGTPISTNLGSVFTSFQYSYDNGSGTLTTAPSSAGSFSFSGSSLVYSAVPEPSNAVAGLLLTALLLRRRR
jgi:autotransporter-associated beta strand protein